MSRFHILHPSWSAGATATANSTAHPSLSAQNLLLIQQSYTWRSDGLGTLRLTFDTGTPKPWQGISLLYHNASSAGTLAVRAHDTTGALFTTPDFESDPVPLLFEGNLDSFPAFHSWFDAGTVQEHRYIGLEIIDTTNPDTYFRAGVFMAGEIFTPRIGPGFGSKIGRDDPSSESTMVNGETVYRPKRGPQVATWPFQKQPFTDAMTWKKIERLYGKHIPLVFKWEPELPGYEQEMIIYGYPQWRGGGAITLATSHGHYDTEISVKEV